MFQVKTHGNEDLAKAIQDKLIELGYQTSHFNAGPATYLGKFDEVYVKISDVRKALSYTDMIGRSILNDNDNIGISAIYKVRKALRKLNIITD